MERISFVNMFKIGNKYILLQSTQYGNIGFSPDENITNIYLNTGLKKHLNKINEYDKQIQQEKNSKNKRKLYQELLNEQINKFLLFNQNILKNYYNTEYIHYSKNENSQTSHEEKLVYVNVFNNKKELVDYIEKYITGTKSYIPADDDYTYIVNNIPNLKFKKYHFPEYQVSYLSFGKLKGIYDYEEILKNEFKETIFPYLKKKIKYIKNLPSKIKEKIDELTELNRLLEKRKMFIKILDKSIKMDLNELKKEDIEMSLYILNSYSLIDKYNKIKQLKEDLEENINNKLKAKIAELEKELEKELKENSKIKRKQLKREAENINKDIKILDEEIKEMNNTFKQLQKLGNRPETIFKELLIKDNINIDISKYMKDYINYYIKSVINHFIINKYNMTVLFENNEDKKIIQNELKKVAKDKELETKIKNFLKELSNEIYVFEEIEKSLLEIYNIFINNLKINNYIKEVIKEDINLIKDLDTIKDLNTNLIEENKELEILKRKLNEVKIRQNKMLKIS